MSLSKKIKQINFRMENVAATFWWGKRLLACDVLKYLLLHRFFHKQESFLRRIKFNKNKT